MQYLVKANGTIMDYVEAEDENEALELYAKNAGYTIESLPDKEEMEIEDLDFAAAGLEVDVPAEDLDNGYGEIAEDKAGVFALDIEDGELVIVDWLFGENPDTPSDWKQADYIIYSPDSYDTRDARGQRVWPGDSLEDEKYTISLG